MITSSANPNVRFAVRLRDARTRRREGLFLIDGRREIDRAVRCGIELTQVIIDAEHDGRSDLFDYCDGISPRPYTLAVSRKLMGKIAFGERNEGIVAVARTPRRTLDRLDAVINARSGTESGVLLGVVERVEKPGNLGAIFRAADGAGLDALLLADPTCELFNPQVIRASLGTVFHVPCAVASGRETLDWLDARRIDVAAALCDGAISYTEYDFTRPTAIVLGTEADGLSPIWRTARTRPIRLPMDGIADSLNVASAAAVLFYHARFARNQASGFRDQDLKTGPS